MLLLGSATGSGAITLRAGNSNGWGRSLVACLVDSSLADCAGAIILARRLAEDQKEAGMLSEAEITCRDLSKMLRDNPGQPGSSPLLRSDVTLELARTVRAQGRLDEARQLCEEANGQILVQTFLAGSYDHQRLCNSGGFVVCRGRLCCSDMLGSRQVCAVSAAPFVTQLPTAAVPHCMQH